MTMKKMTMKKMTMTTSGTQCQKLMFMAVFNDFFTFSGEREKRKDQLLDLQKSKQERTDSELQNLRQVCTVIYLKIL